MESFLFCKLRETGGYHVSFIFQMVESDGGVIKRQVTFGQVNVVHGAGRQALDKVAQVIAEIPYSAADKGHVSAAAVKRVCFQYFAENVKGIAALYLLFPIFD